MRLMTLAATAALTLTILPALANSPDRHHHRGHDMRSMRSGPVDRGPHTADVNRAYMGGGVILEGAPGAPAPMPEPTPPGQAPRNMVPIR